ncbi:uncharacterized protein PpBr36_10610 [Pyricularia pennisetigena]|uniref:uncharacterized protein n=1 Tax=Pyricularia pennisetigena TaxID=1578925 RepID=UPI00115169D9|nr:uncharacterized protein PpBr36_10610 [Pyricularia pennisetigena]TLS21210.1 hypothetical protein PpBr36_10610 [Pyricularia pennisetigena]
MHIFKIVQLLGLLAAGASALPTPAAADAAQPGEGGQSQARTEPGSGNEANVNRPKETVRCPRCPESAFPSVQEYAEHYGKAHPSDAWPRPIAIKKAN